MALKILFWLYLVNAVLSINHEIDSAYWKEWELFKLPGGIGGFLILHNDLHSNRLPISRLSRFK